MKFHRLAPTLFSVCIAIASSIGFAALTFAPQMTNSAIAQEAGKPITTESTAREIALAKHLRKIGAKFYSAYWCPHCHSQKQRFGKAALAQLEVIECDKNGINPQTQLCIDKGIKGFPTWEIGGKFYSGDRTLNNLANISRFSDR